MAPLVNDVMTRDVFAVGPDTSLETAARLLTQRRIHGAPVVDGGRRVVGVVSASDLVDPDRALSDDPGYSLYYRIVDGLPRELGDDVAVRSGRVADVMTRAVVSIEPGATVTEAAERMLSLGIHRLLVALRGELVGVVSMTDLLRALVVIARREAA
jgi:CBS domain-containing protein